MFDSLINFLFGCGRKRTTFPQTPAWDTLTSPGHRHSTLWCVWNAAKNSSTTGVKWLGEPRYRFDRMASLSKHLVHPTR